MDKFKNILSIRVFDNTIELIDDLMEENPGKYETRSHLVRCAIIKLHREEMKNGKILR